MSEMLTAIVTDDGKFFVNDRAIAPVLGGYAVYQRDRNDLSRANRMGIVYEWALAFAWLKGEDVEVHTAL